MAETLVVVLPVVLPPALGPFLALEHLPSFLHFLYSFSDAASSSFDADCVLVNIKYQVYFVHSRRRVGEYSIFIVLVIAN